MWWSLRLVGIKQPPLRGGSYREVDPASDPQVDKRSLGCLMVVGSAVAFCYLAVALEI